MGRNVRGTAVLLALLPLVIVASAAAHPQSTTLTTKPCATISGPKWSQTIKVGNSSKKKAHLREIHGKRYYVFVDHLPCARTSRIVSRLIRIKIPWRLQSASPAGYDCQAGDSRWFRDPYNRDAVRLSEPVTAYGACVLPESIGFTFHTFWWSPAKPR